MAVCHMTCKSASKSYHKCFGNDSGHPWPCGCRYPVMSMCVQGAEVKVIAW